MDPVNVIAAYKKCKLHKRISKIESYSLETVWAYVMGSNLQGAYDSLVDIKAQTDIVTHEHFRNYVDVTKSHLHIDSIFSAKEKGILKMNALGL